MKPIVCVQDLPIYVPTEGCSDCDVALARIDNLTADDIAVDPTRLDFYDMATYTVKDVQDNLNALKEEMDATQENMETLGNSKQDVLVSGVDIKTINGESLLGNGNITISGGGGSITIDTALDTSSTNAVENRAIALAIEGKQNVFSAGDGLSFDGGVLTTPLAQYYCARCNTTTATTSGNGKLVPLVLQKGHGQVFTASSGTLICNVAGTYEISATAMWTPDTSGTTCPVDVMVTAAGNSLTARAISTGGVAVTAVISPIPISFAEGDTVDMSVTATGKPGSIAGGFRYTRVMLRRLA